LKKSFSLFVFLLFVGLMTNQMQAQSSVMNLQGYNDEPYHFGFILGGNQMLFSVRPINNLSAVLWRGDQIPDIASDSLYVYHLLATGAPGFSVGILGNLRLGAYADLRFIPTLSFGSRSLIYDVKAFKNGQALESNQPNGLVRITKQVNSTYVIFPLVVKLRSWRANNVGAYFLGGAEYGIDLAAAKKTKQNLGPGTIKLKSHDLALQLGAGFDFYTNYFKLGIEAKMSYGLNNLIVDENDFYAGSIDQLHAKMFLLSFIFE
jgi:hypothetical protein